MRAAVALLACTAIGLLRSRRGVAAFLLFFAGVAALSMLVGTSGPPEGSVKFYITIAWFLVFAGSLIVAVTTPLRLCARDRRARLLDLLGTRPLPRFGYLAAYGAAAALAGGASLLLGGAAVAGGVKMLSYRLGVDTGFLAGAAVFPMPVREADPRAVEKLARELAADAAFRARHGDEGVRRLAREALGAWRLAVGETTTIAWRGLPAGAASARLRVQANVYPPWEEVEGEFSIGRDRLTRRLRSGLPQELAFAGDAIDAAGTLAIEVRIRSAGSPLVVLEPPDGLAVYVPAISFLENLGRACALAFTVIAAAGAAGLLAGIALSHPVGVLAAVVIVVLVLGASIYTEALAEFSGPLDHYHRGEVPREPLPRFVREAWQAVMSVAVSIVPTAGAIDPGTELAEGRSIAGEELVRAGFGTVALRGGVTLLLAWLLFRRQELGRRGTA